MSRRRRLIWSPKAEADLVARDEWMPAATARARLAMKRMAASGFNYGRSVPSEPGVWYLPTDKVGLFYTVAPGVLEVGRVVDTRRLRQLP